MWTTLQDGSVDRLVLEEEVVQAAVAAAVMSSCMVVHPKCQPPFQHMQAPK